MFFFSGSNNTIRFHSYSLLFYFWPLWLLSLGFGYLKSFGIIGNSDSHGIIFIISFLFILFSVTVNIRGIWVVLLLSIFVIACLVLHQFDLLEGIIADVLNLKIFIEDKFFIVFGWSLFAIWLVVSFLYDRRRFVEFKPATFTVVEEIGYPVDKFDTTGLSVKKLKDNFIQHFIFGLGSGDLKITVNAGGEKQVVRVNNVLRVSNKLKKIEAILDNKGRANQI